MYIIESIVYGLPQGAMYGLMAFGISLIFKTFGALNFSHGYAGMISTFVALTIYIRTENLIISILGALIFAFVMGIMIEKILMRKIKKASAGSMLIMTLGLLMIYEGLALLIWGPDFQIFPPIYEGNPLIIDRGDLFIFLESNDIIKAIIALVVTVSLAVFLKFTKMGTAIRARSQDEVGAKVVGIDVNKTDMIVWGIGITLTALVGILVANKENLYPTMMINYQLFGFTAGVLGGFSNPFGAIVGGLILGVLEQFVANNLSPDYQLSIILILIIVVLVVKPSGIFGKAFEGRV